MRLPGQNRTGLAQAAAFLATILIISLGLCGANFVAFARWGNYETNRAPWWPSSFLVYAGIIESMVIAGCILGLLFVSLFVLDEWVRARFSATRNRKGKL